MNGLLSKALNGQNVYNGCCALHIDFSKLKKLSVRYNNDKSRDFTNPHLGSDDRHGGEQVPGAGIYGPYPGQSFNMDSSGNGVFGFFPGNSIAHCTERWGAGVVVCLERGADLHMAQLMPLPLTVSCFSKIQIGFSFLVPAHLGSPGQRAVKWVCGLCVCISIAH